MVIASCAVGGLFGTDCQFCFLPNRFEFLDIAALEVSTQRGFHAREAIEKTLVGPCEAFFPFSKTE